MYQIAKNTAVDFDSQYTEAAVKALGCSYIPYCSPIKNGDITGVQIIQDTQPIKAKALWDFSSGTAEQWTAGAGWLFNASPPESFVGTATSNAITVSSIIEPSGIYRITFTVLGYSSGTVTPQIGTVAGDAVSANGTYTQTITSADNSVGDLNINGNAYTGEVTDICLEHLGYSSDWELNNSEGWTTGNFSLVLSGTTYVMRHTSGGGTTALSRAMLETGEVYKVIVNVTSHSSGTLTISGGTTDFGEIDENIKGAFTFYGVAQSDTLLITPTDDLVAEIESIEVYKMYTGSLVGICDTDCTFLEFLDSSEYLTQTNDTLAVQVDWESHALDESLCYTLCYFDAEANCLTTSAILNAGLDDSSYWVLPTGTAISGNQIAILSTTAADARVRNVAVLCPETKYRVQFVVSFSGGGGGAYVIVNAGGTASAPITSDGSQDFEITTASGDEFNFQVNDDGGSIFILNIVVTAVIDEETTPTGCSNCFQFSCCETTYITWNNTYNGSTRDAFGFRYKAYPTYTNSYRMAGRLQTPSFNAEIETNINDARDIFFANVDVRSKKSLVANRIPNWLVKSLVMASYHNNFQVAGTKYANLEGDTTQTDLNCLMSTLQIELTESGNKNVNV